MSVAGCVFCEIIDGTRPAAIVASDEAAVAFLDARPVFKGHTLVVPRAHVATLTDLPAVDLGPYFASVQRLARAVEVGLEADGTFVAMNNKVSQSVAHLHTHVVPRRRKDGLRGFFWPRVPYASDAERDHFAARVRGAV
jgi:histidine triad (HIT) family protein